MGIVYYYEFSQLKDFSLDITKEKCGKIFEAVLHIEVLGINFNLKLKNPKVPSNISMSVKELFDKITPKSISSFKVFGKQHKPDTRLWHIEIWKDSPIKTVHCGEIEGLPKEGWKNKTVPAL